MILTEAEAKEKECRVLGLPADGVIKTCSASSCMAWRWAGMFWDGTRLRYGATKLEAERCKYDKDGNLVQLEQNYVIGGFCGLAGRPE